MYFTEHWAPFRYFFTDDQDRLYVLTYEEGAEAGQYMYDVFNSEGVFISRISLWNQSQLDIEPLTVKARGGNLYCLRHKDNGYKEIQVFNMRWE